MKKLIFIPLCLAMFFMSSCLNMDKISYEGVKKVDVQGMTFSAAGVDVSLEVNNGSNSNINILDGEATVYTQSGKPMILITLKDNVLIPKKSVSTVVFPINIQFKMNVLQMLGSRPSDYEKATVSGFVTVRSGMVKKKLKFNDLSFSEFTEALEINSIDDLF